MCIEKFNDEIITYFIAFLTFNISFLYFASVLQTLKMCKETFMMKNYIFFIILQHCLLNSHGNLNLAWTIRFNCIAVSQSSDTMTALK